MAYTRADTSAADLTGAAAVEFFIKPNAWCDDTDTRNLHLTVGAGITVSDAVAGIAYADITAAQSAALPAFGELFYFARATLADGTVIYPDNLRGSFWTDPTAALSQAAGGAELMPIPAPSANYVINRYDITGLTAGTKPLAAIDISTIKTVNPVFLVFFPGSILAMYRLRALGTDTPAAQWLVQSTQDPLYSFELIKVTKQGADCIWNAADSKFYQTVGNVVDGVVTETVAGAGFQLPT